ncbi:hypothetical protein Taro_011628 [Colocasia esculenta]|uniref:Uncharacterized protein n=1 Tax=Colocasia esculenta TaxID=4460 RepID=A0A843U6P8_COLES|nr:hypothetical protein [Colocasia esculenta]
MCRGRARVPIKGPKVLSSIYCVRDRVFPSLSSCCSAIWEEFDNLGSENSTIGGLFWVVFFRGSAFVLMQYYFGEFRLPGGTTIFSSYASSVLSVSIQEVCSSRGLAAGRFAQRRNMEIGLNPLKHPKEADQVEAIVGEEFKEDPTSQITEHRLGLQVCKLLPNPSFYKGVHLKNEVVVSRCAQFELSNSRFMIRLLVPAGQCTTAPLFGHQVDPTASFPLFSGKKSSQILSQSHQSFIISPLLHLLSEFHSSCTMVRKLGPRRGARSRASSRPIPAEVAVEQLERRTKRRNDPAEQPGSSSAPQRAAKRGRASSSGRGSSPPNPRTDIPGDSSENPEESSSSSSESQEDIPSESVIREFYKNLTCTEEGYESKVKGIAIDMPTEIAASIFKVPDEVANYHEFEFNLHEAYSILTGLPADESDPKQTYVTRFNANSFPPVLRVINHILTTIITPQGGGRDRLTDIQRFILYCMNEKSQSIPKSNIYTFKNIQKFMGFRLEGNQIRRGPAVVEAPQVQEEQPQDQGDQPQPQEDQPQVQGDQPQAQEEQPPAEGDQPLGQEDQPPVHEDQPQVPTEELISFLNDKFEFLNSSIQTMSTSFELRIQRLENTVSAKFIEQKAASDYAAQSTRLSFAHFVDDLETGSSSSSQPIATDLARIQATLMENSDRMEHFLVDTLSEQVDTGPSSQNNFSQIWDSNPLKHPKEADQVEAIVGEEFKEDPTSQITEHRLGLQVCKLLPNPSFYKGVHLKNEVVVSRCAQFELSNSRSAGGGVENRVLSGRPRIRFPGSLHHHPAIVPHRLSLSRHYASSSTLPSRPFNIPLTNMRQHQER